MAFRSASRSSSRLNLANTAVPATLINVPAAWLSQTRVRMQASVTPMLACCIFSICCTE
jgi:hypothetical protein